MLCSWRFCRIITNFHARLDIMADSDSEGRRFESFLACQNQRHPAGCVGFGWLYIESFNARMQAEFLDGELFDTMYEAQVLTQRWIRYYNQIRPHSILGGRPPAPQTLVPSLLRIPDLLTLFLGHKSGADHVRNINILTENLVISIPDIFDSDL